jgi:cell division protein FtsB
MNRRKKSRLGLFIFLCLLGYFAYIILNQQQEFNAKNAELNAVHDKVKQEKELGKQLDREKADVNSDEYNEKIARDKLGMVKSGDKVFVDIGK